MAYNWNGHYWFAGEEKCIYCGAIKCSMYTYENACRTKSHTMKRRIDHREDLEIL